MGRKFFLDRLACPKCGEKYTPARPVNLCRCGSPLLAEYDLTAIAHSLKRSDLVLRSQSLWRYREFLPVENDQNIISLGEGMTPMISVKRLGENLGLNYLYIKDEGLNPTGTFKARGAAVGVSRAKELGITGFAMPTAGNAGGAWATYAARAGMKALIVMPEDAPEQAKRECLAAGAETYLVRGLISDAGKIIGRAARRHGWFEAATLKEPYRIEGKKTMGYEIMEQFNWIPPDAIIYPTGGGVGIIGIWKALRELEATGWIRGTWPKLIAVQAEGCSPIVRAFRQGKSESQFFQRAQTLAAGLRVPLALGDFLVLKAVRETGGTCESVTDQEIIQAMGLAARTEGMLIAPEGAAAVAGALKLAKEGFLAPGERVVILNTGTGLKHPELVTGELPVLEADEDIPA